MNTPNKFGWLRNTPETKQNPSILEWVGFGFSILVIIILLVLMVTTASGQTISDWSDGTIKNGCDDRFTPVGGFAGIVQDQPFFSGTSQLVFGPAQSGINTVFPLSNSTNTHQARFRYLSGNSIVVAVLYRPNCGYQIITLPPTTNTAKNVVLNYKCQTQSKIMFWTVGLGVSWFILDDFALDNPTDNLEAEIYEQSDWQVTTGKEPGRVMVYQDETVKGWKEVAK